MKFKTDVDGALRVAVRKNPFNPFVLAELASCGMAIPATGAEQLYIDIAGDVASAKSIETLVLSLTRALGLRVRVRKCFCAILNISVSRAASRLRL